MHLLLIQVEHRLARNGTVPWREEVGRVCTALKYAGHTVSFMAPGSDDHDALRRAIAEKRPQRVLVYLPSVGVAAGRRLIGHLAETYFLPVVVFGPAATCNPTEALSIPGVSGAGLVECEQALVEHFRRVEAGGDPDAPLQVPSMWFNAERGTVKNEIGPLREDLDAIDPPDRSHMDYQRHVDAVGVAEFHVTRGCPQRCTYCINDWIADAYADAGPFVRRRGVEHLLTEIREVLGTYKQVKALQFNDCMFAADEAWLEQFAAQLAETVDMPFTCHVRANTCSQGAVRLLAAAGCTEAHVHVICGSAFVRNEIFEMDTSENQLRRVFHTLAEAGIRTVAYCLIGSPYETEITIEQTQGLIERLNPSAVAVAPFYPLPASRARELCQENGWLSGRGERAFFEGHSVLDMPALPPANIGRFCEGFLGKLRLGPDRKRRLSRSRKRTQGSHPFQYPACDLFAVAQMGR
jgi:radical SAM superfamily enzyme YgiQ (UPF0313 family)